MKLTPNFTLEEFCRSETAERLNLDNTPPPLILARLGVVAFGMEGVKRLANGAAILVKSGYRNAAVNAAVGGTSTSDHMDGWCCDFVAAGITPLDMARRIAESPLVWDQLILEGSRGVVHISFEPRLRRLVQSQPGGPRTPLYAGLMLKAPA